MQVAPISINPHLDKITTSNVIKTAKNPLKQYYKYKNKVLGDKVSYVKTYNDVVYGYNSKQIPKAKPKLLGTDDPWCEAPGTWDSKYLGCFGSKERNEDPYEDFVPWDH